jgi:hypothetical protein
MPNQEKRSQHEFNEVQENLEKRDSMNRGVGSTNERPETFNRRSSRTEQQMKEAQQNMEKNNMKESWREIRRMLRR